MKKILVFISVQDGHIKRSSLEVLTRCRRLASENNLMLEAAVIAPQARSHAEVVARYGAPAVYIIDDQIFSGHINELYLNAATTIVKTSSPSVIAFASSEAVKDILGALSVRLDGSALPDVAEFELSGGEVIAKRPVLASKVFAHSKASREPVIVSVRSGSYDAVEAPVTPEIKIIPFSFAEDSLTIKLKNFVKSSAEGVVDLAEADIVVTAGRGVKDETGRQLVEKLANALGGAVGATRAAVDTGLFPATAQIGQTGKVVSPSLYFAIGVSGAIQHTAGMSNSRIVVAINRDPEAPIFKYATYGIVGDLYQVLPILIEKLLKARALS